MKKTFLILFFIASINSYSQKKEVVYVDANDNEITAKQYKSLDKKVFFVRETENDTAIVKRIFLHRIYGKLDTIQHSKINTYLEKIIGKEYDRNKKSVIHLYRKNDGKILNDAQYNKFWGYIKRHSDELQAFLIGTKLSEIKPNPENNIYSDPDDQLVDVFFKNSEFNLHHLVIKPNGEIYIFQGFEDILNVLDMSANL